MKKVTYKFNSSGTDFYFDVPFSSLGDITPGKNTVIITDENIYNSHQEKFKSWKTIVLKPGEENKVSATVDHIIGRLIELKADRKTILIGVGGGVITDLTGYVASIYMRGVPFGFVPTSILAMADAAVGGKNGIDVGVYKNMVGTFRQPGFLLYDISFLETLPHNEWANGFAEIIKHACIRDKKLMELLQENNIHEIREHRKRLIELIRRNVEIKSEVVITDEFEKGERKLLNFGHTLAHAIEKQNRMPHGHAVAVGMSYDCVISREIMDFRQTEKVISVLQQYQLPTFAAFDKKQAVEVLRMDKKRQGDEISYIVLKKLGKAVIINLPLTDLEKIIEKV